MELRMASEQFDVNEYMRFPVDMTVEHSAPCEGAGSPNEETVSLETDESSELALAACTGTLVQDVSALVTVATLRGVSGAAYVSSGSGDVVVKARFIRRRHLMLLPGAVQIDVFPGQPEKQTKKVFLLSIHSSPLDVKSASLVAAPGKFWEDASVSLANETAAPLPPLQLSQSKTLHELQVDFNLEEVQEELEGEGELRVTYAEADSPLVDHTERITVKWTRGCKAGEFRDDNAAAGSGCTPCPEDQYKAEPGPQPCDPVPEGSTTAGFTGTTLETLLPQEGFWRFSDNDTTFWECPRPTDARYPLCTDPTEYLNRTQNNSVFWGDGVRLR